MYAIYGNIYHQYTPNVSMYTIHGAYGLGSIIFVDRHCFTSSHPNETRRQRSRAFPARSMPCGSEESESSRHLHLLHMAIGQNPGT